MLFVPDCSDRTARTIDNHVLNVPLTLMMGRRYFFARMAELVDAPDLGSDAARHEGSSPSPSTVQCFLLI